MPMKSSRHHPPRHAIMSRRQRGAVLVSATALLLTGLGWLYSHYWLTGPLPGLPHPSEAWWLRLHGAAMFGGLLALGSLLPHHVAHGLRQPRRRPSGLLMLGGTILLTLSGYGLYYLSGEDMRAATSLVHWVAGLVLAPVLLLHVPRLAAWNGPGSGRRGVVAGVGVERFGPGR